MHSTSLLQEPHVWASVFFVIMLILFLWKGRGPAENVLQGRVDRVKGEIERAASLRREAQEGLAHQQALRKKALEQADSIVAAAQEEAHLLQKEAQVLLDDMVQRKELYFKRHLQQEEEKVVSTLHSYLADAVVAGVKERLSEQRQRQSGYQALFNQACSLGEKALQGKGMS